MISRTAVQGSRSVLLFSVLYLVPFWLAAQATEASKSQTSKVKPNEVHFEDIAQQAGLSALNVYGGEAHKEFIIETTGNGAVIFDYDNDGWPDIYLPNDKTGLKTEKAEWSTGCSFVDVDRDGRPMFLSRAT